MLDVAVIGLGWWARTLTRALSQNAKPRVVMAVDVNPARSQAC